MKQRIKNTCATCHNTIYQRKWEINEVPPPNYLYKSCPNCGTLFKKYKEPVVFEIREA